MVSLFVIPTNFGRTLTSMVKLDDMKKYFWFALLVVVLVGCGAKENGNEVTFAVFGEPAEFAAYESLVMAFEAEHPDIDIKLTHIPGQSQYRQRLATGFSAGLPPDVFLLNYRRFAKFASQGALEPLASYLDGSDLIQVGDFYAPTIKSFVYEEVLHCIPQNVSSLVVYYNKDLFDNAGISYPTPDWTWSDFLTTAQTLTIDEDGDGIREQHGLGITPNFFRLAPFIWQNGGEIVDDYEKPTRLTLDSPASLNAFQWFVDLQVKHSVVPTAIEESAQESETRFLNGQMGMLLNSRRGVPTYRTIDSFAWDVAALPAGVENAGILHSDAYCMAHTTPHKELAWTFIEFANSVAGQTIVAASGRTVPSLKAVAESSAFLDPNQPPANSQVYLNTIPILRGVPVMDAWVGVEEVVGKEVERAFYGTASVAEAVETANRLSASYFP